MKKSVSIALMALLAIAAFALSACGSPSGPELTVRAYFDAVNAGDKAKFVSLFCPDHQEAAASTYESYTTFQRKFPTVKKIVVQDFGDTGTIKDVTVEVVEESSFGEHDKTLKCGLLQQEDQWCFFTPLH